MHLIGSNCIDEKCPICFGEQSKREDRLTRAIIEYLMEIEKTTPRVWPYLKMKPEDKQEIK